MKFNPEAKFGSAEGSLPARGAWIEIKPCFRAGLNLQVAPRKGSVD